MPNGTRRRCHFSTSGRVSVSADLLRFEVTSPGQPVTATVEFSAGTRTQSDAHVVLSVDPIRGLEGPGGAGDVEASLSFAGHGEGTLDGMLRGAGPTVAGQWIGSGLRHGRLVFALRAGATGTYTVPVRGDGLVRATASGRPDTEEAPRAVGGRRGGFAAVPPRGGKTFRISGRFSTDTTNDTSAASASRDKVAGISASPAMRAPSGSDSTSSFTRWAPLRTASKR